MIKKGKERKKERKGKMDNGWGGKRASGQATR